MAPGNPACRQQLACAAEMERGQPADEGQEDEQGEPAEEEPDAAVPTKIVTQVLLLLLVQGEHA